MNRRHELDRRKWASATLLSAVFLATAALAEETNMDTNVTYRPAPVRMSPEKLAGIGLSQAALYMEPEEVLAGKHAPRSAVLYRGDDLILEVYEDGPATFAINEPFPHDESVLMLAGKLILTDAAGQAHEFVKGDSLVIPKGFTGKWQMIGDFRALTVINREVYDSVYGSGDD